MRRSSKSKDEKAAELTIFCDENNSNEYITFNLKLGENIIGKNPQRCNVVCKFSSEIDDVNTKITIEESD